MYYKNFKGSILVFNIKTISSANSNILNLRVFLLVDHFLKSLKELDLLSFLEEQPSKLTSKPHKIEILKNLFLNEIYSVIHYS
jgi:hypothetical protein